MTVSHCLHQALRIARQPRQDWAAAIEVLPQTCAYDDCGAPRNCRERIAEYLRMQWRISERKQQAKA
jgi:hypothetical protein